MTGVTVTSTNPLPAVGTPVTFTAAITASPAFTGGGTVQFTIDNGATVVSVPVSGGAASYTTSALTAGGHTVVAVYSGDATYAGSTSATFTQQVAASVTGFTTLASFPTFASTGVTPFEPTGPMLRDSTGNLFGTAAYGGVGGTGGVFELALGSTTITTVAEGTFANGLPYVNGGLAIDNQGDLFGTASGLNGNSGGVFEIVSGTTNMVKLAGFPAGVYAVSPVVLDAVGNIYGTTLNGGASGKGSIFEIAKGSNTVVTIASFNGTNGSSPQAGMILDSSGNLFGTTNVGGGSGRGVIFKLAAGSSVITPLASFATTDSSGPKYPLTLDASGDLFGVTDLGANNKGLVYELVKNAPAITRVASFNGTNGSNPVGPLSLDAAGNLYGVTVLGGSSNNGTLFEVVHGTNAITDLVTFNGSNGSNPQGLGLDSTGTFYGATQSSNSGVGTVFTFQFTGLTAPAIIADAGDVQTYQPADGSGPQAVEFVLTAQRADGTPATINYRTVDGTAKAGVDYKSI